MKQKAALIAALIHQPKLLLLDEPFVGLDPKAAFTLKEMFKELTQQGSMILFSSHVLEVVEKITNRIAIIKQGKIIAQGETKTIVKDKNLEALFLESL
jgi:ABC-2 type transport system ATP-binding protein